MFEKTFVHLKSLEYKNNGENTAPLQLDQKLNFY